MRPVVVIVGAGPAGARCAELVADGANVTLIGAEPELPYNRVALSKLLAGDLDEAELVTHDAARLADLRIAYRGGSRVLAIDRAGRRVQLTDGDSVPYDALVLATGAQAFRLPVPGAHLPGVVMYRTLAEVRAMLAAAQEGGEAVVIGGGLLGLEAAAGLARRGMRVTVVHAVDRLMERQLDAGAAAMLARRLAAQGIGLVLSASTTAIEGDDMVQAVLLSDGRRLTARMVVMAVGIRPDAALGREAGLAVERGIVVDDAMRSSDPTVLAIGECAQHHGVCCGLVAPALAQAAIAARTLRGEIAAYVPETEATALKVAGAGVWSAGEIEAADAHAILYDDPDGFEYRRFLVRDDRLVGALLFGETGDAAWYQRLIATRAPMTGMRAALPFGMAYAPPDGASADLAQAAG